MPATFGQFPAFFLIFWSPASNLVKKAYSRMELVRRIKYFTKSTTNKLRMNKTFIRNNH